MLFKIALCLIIVNVVCQISQVDCNYDNYIKLFSKKYSSEENLQARRDSIFLPKCRSINANIRQFNNGQINYYQKLTKWTDQTEEEISKVLKLEQLSNDNTLKSYHRASTLLTSENTSTQKPVGLPSSLDYKAQGYVTSIKDQGNCGCCWAFAANAVYESYLLLAQKGSNDLSEQATLECTDLYSSGRSNSCDGGYIEDVLTMLNQLGGVTEEKYPYTSYYLSTGKPSTPGICTDKDRIYLQKGVVNMYSSLSNSQIKTLLLEEGPLVVGVYADNGFQSYGGGVYSGCPVYSAYFINHAVMLYGYDSSGNWLIKNQWGNGWGEEGFMRLSSKYDCGLNSMIGNIKLGNITNIVQLKNEVKTSLMCILLLFVMLLIVH